MDRHGIVGSWKRYAIVLSLGGLVALLSPASARAHQFAAGCAALSSTFVAAHALTEGRPSCTNTGSLTCPPTNAGNCLFASQAVITGEGLVSATVQVAGGVFGQASCTGFFRCATPQLLTGIGAGFTLSPGVECHGDFPSAARGVTLTCATQDLQ